MQTVELHLRDDLAADLDVRATAARLSRDEYVMRALEHFALHDDETKRELAAFFANAEKDLELCEGQVSENGRRVLASVEWKPS